MALWGISTTTETEANNYAIPKHLEETDRNTTPWNAFADERGWIYRRYGTTEHSGLSTNYYDEVLVPVAGLNTAGLPSDLGSTGLAGATPVAVFFEDPNLASPISVAAGGTTGIGTGTTGYVHVVWNETVFCSAGATVLIQGHSAAGVGTTTIVGTAASVTPDSSIVSFANTFGFVDNINFNGQVSNRIAFAFTAPVTGVGTYLGVSLAAGVVGTITDFAGGNAVIKTLSSDLLRQVGGAGTITETSVGIGATSLVIVA